MMGGHLGPPYTIGAWATIRTNDGTCLILCVLVVKVFFFQFQSREIFSTLNISANINYVTERFTKRGQAICVQQITTHFLVPAIIEPLK